MGGGDLRPSGPLYNFLNGGGGVGEGGRRNHRHVGLGDPGPAT
jgi:hypothetical protein